MQVDPNFSNFLLDVDKARINLLDFGACLSFEDSWVEKYKGVIVAAADNNREGVLHYSLELGFLTGRESARMKEAHIDSVMALGQPFQSLGKYDFARQVGFLQVCVDCLFLMCYFFSRL
jgi:aarF domain-containing kinase